MDINENCFKGIKIFYFAFPINFFILKILVTWVSKELICCEMIHSYKNKPEDLCRFFMKLCKHFIDILFQYILMLYFTYDLYVYKRRLLYNISLYKIN